MLTVNNNAMHRSCGTNPRYAHLYSSTHFLSASFYLPDPAAPPAGPPSVGRGSEGQTSRVLARWTAAADEEEVLQEEEEGEEEEMRDAFVMMEPLPRRPSEGLTAGTMIDVNITAALRHFQQDGAVAAVAPGDSDRMASELLAYLQEGDDGSIARLQLALKQVEQHGKAGCGLDMIKVTWRCDADKDVRQTMRENGDVLVSRCHGARNVMVVHLLILQAPMDRRSRRCTKQASRSPSVSP